MTTVAGIFVISFLVFITYQMHSGRINKRIKIAALFFLVCFSLLGFQSAKEAFYAVQSARWPSVQGRVIESSFYRPFRGKGNPVIRYEYTVSGIKYIGVKPFSDSKRRNEIISFYKNNPDIAIYYNPTKPWVSTITRGFQWDRNGAFLAAMLIIFLTCIVGIIVWLKTGAKISVYDQ
jgi:hypothetical protein